MITFPIFNDPSGCSGLRRRTDSRDLGPGDRDASGSSVSVGAKIRLITDFLRYSLLTWEESASRKV